jgi:heparin/heparan-sulfate lyase
VASNPEHKKHWLLHSMEEPAIEGSQSVISLAERGWSGKLVNRTLMPEAGNVEISKVGGPGKEFWVFGKNYPTEPTQKDWAQRSYEPGAWRLELSPRKPSEGDFFLVVMQVSERGSNARLPVALAEEGDQVGCKVGEKKVLFSRATGRVTGVLGRPVR